MRKLSCLFWTPKWYWVRSSPEHSRWPPPLLGFSEVYRVYENHDSLPYKKIYVIHVYISAGRANHYKPSLKVGSIVKDDRFEVARCSSMYKITDHLFLIRFIPPTIIDEVITGAPEINLQS
ncbi:hypothetical protein DY000_02051101 [Brassica cretica]|uniref:Uncharacterized protein n=1 Tax=Brassica cretica TaxID=69181 RepID=A0ABQ7F689_BRACR|nr:hypothetical protein DY000_02051101 [Brassica cretica]